jgi:hypothetical protein
LADGHLADSHLADSHSANTMYVQHNHFTIKLFLNFVFRPNASWPKCFLIQRHGALLFGSWTMFFGDPKGNGHLTLKISLHVKFGNAFLNYFQPTLANKNVSNLHFDMARGQCYKTFFFRNSRMFVIS